MKTLLGMACLFVLGVGPATAGGIGGLGGGTSVTVYYDSTTHTLYIPGRLDDHFGVVTRGAPADPGLRTYSLDVRNFNLLQDMVDTRQTVSARGESGGSKSYRLMPGDEQQQVELIDRRAVIRAGESN